MHSGNSNQNHSGLARSRPMHLNDSRCDGSSVKADILMAITGHGPTYPVGGTHYQRQKVSDINTNEKRIVFRIMAKTTRYERVSAVAVAMKGRGIWRTKDYEIFARWFKLRRLKVEGCFTAGPEKYKGWFIPLKFTIFRQAEGKPVLTSLRCRSGVRECPLEILSFLVCSFILLFVPVLSSVTCYFVEIL
ncbi:hypothetical protein AVEN_81825-1 [Araneus ventricosus]|uniref:Uncharacterized protein n=1 Tax=Araneus ventricosus TaxID=182803 RepID=A0A4Y2ST47_ARAVE|nr:hypothetical protein AVEN_81825-1 [Araneus ventricosus]